MKNPESKIFVFGGLCKAWEEISSTQLSTIFSKTLGTRAENAAFSYFDVFNSLLSLAMSGGSCLEDLQYLRSTHEQGFPFRLCSPDTAGYAIEELAVDDRMVCTGNSAHFFNQNQDLNRLLIKSARALKVVGRSVDLDLDGKVFGCNKKDARPAYTGEKGYQPMMAFCGRIPLYVEGRNGNTNASFKMHLSLKNITELLAEEGMKLRRVRIDAAGCQKKVIQFLQRNNVLFYIRCTDVLSHLEPGLQWKKTKIGKQELEITETRWFGAGYRTPFRLIVQRTPNTSGQIDAFTGESYTYRGIITNDSNIKKKKVIQYYNQRGGAERNFDYLGNDFNLNWLPFSKMSLNTVYMQLMALAMTTFEYLKRILSGSFGPKVIKWRLKRFIYRYVIQPFRIVRHARTIQRKYYPGYG